MSIKNIYDAAQKATAELKNAIDTSMSNFVESARSLVGFASKERLPYSKKVFICEETGKRWNGRGRPPHWVIEQISKNN